MGRGEGMMHRIIITEELVINQCFPHAVIMYDNPGEDVFKSNGN